MNHILCIEHTTSNHPRGLLAEKISALLPSLSSTSISTVHEAIPLLHHHHGIVLVDVQSASHEELQLLTHTTHSLPYTTLIAAIPEPTYELVQTMLTLGASDVCAFPPRDEELQMVVRRQHERLQKLSKEIDRTINDVALKISFALPHEFRTPLNGLIGFISLLRHEGIPDEEKPMAYSYLESSVHRLRLTAEKFLLYAELEQLHINKHLKEQFAPRHFATYGAHSMALEVGYETLDMLGRTEDAVFHVDSDECAVQIRAQHLRFIIAELLTNACKFSNPHTPIILSTQHDQHTFSLSVQDTGRGFHTLELARIAAFNQFGREYFEQQGIGLGLPIVKKIVALYGGTLDIESTQHGGTTVTMHIPLAPLSNTEEGYASVQYITMHTIHH